MSIGGTAIARLALAQASPAIDYAEISEAFQPGAVFNSSPYFGFDALGCDALGQLGRYQYALVEDTVTAANVTSAVIVEVSSDPNDEIGTVFGFAALGQVALGELINTLVPHQFDIYDATTDFIVNYIVETFSNQFINVPATFGFAPLGQVALGESQNTAIAVPVSDTVVAGANYYVYDVESTQITQNNAGSYYNFASIGEEALGQLGAQITITQFIDVEDATRTAKPPNLDDLWWNNVKFRRNDHHVRVSQPVPPGPGWDGAINIRPSSQFYTSILETASLVDTGADAFVSTFSNDNSTNYFLFDVLGHLALGQLGINPLGPRPPYEASITETFGPTSSDIGTIFGFSALGQVAMGQLTSVIIPNNPVFDTIDAFIISNTGSGPLGASEPGRIIP